MCACPATHGLSYVRDWDILVFFDLGVNIISIDHCLSVLPVIHFISESVYVLYVFYIIRFRLIRVYSY